MANRLKEWARSIKRDVRALYLASRDPRVPWYAKALGIADRTGSLEPGKMADVVLWSADPFSVYAMAEQVYIDGALTFDRHDPRFQALIRGATESLAAWNGSVMTLTGLGDPEIIIGQVVSSGAQDGEKLGRKVNGKGGLACGSGVCHEGWDRACVG